MYFFLIYLIMTYKLKSRLKKVSLLLIVKITHFFVTFTV